ncbi:hypothetical protein JAAARDRAFT_27671 [Jaapia argillacea MUCL 33604]|uniref:Uncharacterized protein n=1 Tax=Jaapia argillacea MUCL 33604 TaxID=933084 RepID=A0A067QAF5_9AGAM|nr:hypothetical protein JAAARDRAFT_27671 [Jaapia argillacea MUCL 33604]
MLRVLATIQRSSFANRMKNEQIDLANWVREIHGAWDYLSHLLSISTMRNGTATQESLQKLRQFQYEF